MLEGPLRFETKAIRVGQDPDPATGAIVQPIHVSSTFKRKSIEQTDGYGYSRVANPTRAAAEACLASLENGQFCFLFSSGMAASTAVLGLLSPGDHIVCVQDLYAGTHSLFNLFGKQRGIETTYAPCETIEDATAAFRPNTKLLWLESPTNPLNQVLDLAALAEVGHRHGALVAVDNTFASPYFQNPLDLGVDIVVHSATKYLGGHSDLIGGAVAFNRQDLFDPLWDQQAVGGAVPSAFDCFLLLRGMRTLSVRMREHERNGAAVAAFLREHPKVEATYYPGFSDSPNYELAKSQMRGFSGMVSVKVKGGYEATKRFAESTKIFQLGSSLGGVESLIGYPNSMSHSSMSDEEKAARGLTPNLVRLSVGLEHADDLIEDLDQALRQA